MAIKRNLKDPLAKSEFDYGSKVKTKTKTRGDKTIRKEKVKKDGVVTKTKNTYSKGKLVKQKIKERRTIGKLAKDLSASRQKRLDDKLKRELTKAQIRKAKSLRATPKRKSKSDNKKSKNKSPKYFS